MPNTIAKHTDTKEVSISSFDWLPYISLNRQPNSKQSRELVSYIVGKLINHRNSNPNRRKIGPIATERLKRQTAAIVAGLCYGCIQRHQKAVMAPKAFEGDFWKSTGNLIGNRAFWANITDLEALGLVEVLKRKHIKRNDGSFISLSPALIPTPLLYSLAEKYGCNRRETLATDWVLCPSSCDASAQALRATEGHQAAQSIDPCSLLTFGHWPNFSRFNGRAKTIAAP